MEISQHENNWLIIDGKQFVSKLGIKAGDTVLDFGCGEGRYSIPLAQAVGEEGHVYALEQSLDTIAILKNKLELVPKTNNITILHANTVENQAIIANQSVDAIMIFDVLQYIPNKAFLFMSFLRVLKPTGTIHIYPAAIPHPGDVDMQQIIAELQRVNWQLTNSAEYTLMHSTEIINDTVYSFQLKKT